MKRAMMSGALLILTVMLLVLASCGPGQGIPTACEKDATTCPDGSKVARELPSCEFAACPEPGPAACPADAKVCPDGRTVGRIGPDCEFTPCPSEVTSATCGKEGTDKYLGINDAMLIAAQSECGDKIEGTRFCNEGTGTWWIDLDITTKGCSPACVVDVVTKKAEINWRCTGAVAPDNDASGIMPVGSTGGNASI
jgi:hypothetical protein